MLPGALINWEKHSDNIIIPAPFKNKMPQAANQPCKYKSKNTQPEKLFIHIYHNNHQYIYMNNYLCLY